jgi:hypothetical protein
VIRFLYLRDSLFILGCSLYAINRWIFKPHVHSAFLHNHFNDLLLIPCALPVLLLMHRCLGLRATDEPPAFREIALYLVVWSLLFEVAGPQLFKHCVGDAGDVLAYAAGGLLAGLWWQRHPRRAKAAAL